MKHPNEHFLRQRYKHGIDIAGEELDESACAEIKRRAFVDQTPDNFSQELFFAYEKEALKSYLNNWDVLPYYRHYAYEFLWRSSPYESPYTDRLVQLYPNLTPDLILELSREPGLLPHPQAPKVHWQSIGSRDAGLYELAERFAHCGTAIITPRFGIGGGEKVVRLLANTLESVTGSKTCIVVADTQHGPEEGVAGLSSIMLDGKPFLQSLPERRITALRDFLHVTGVRSVFTANSWLANIAVQGGALGEWPTAYGIFSKPISRSGEIGGYVRDLDWVVPNVSALFTDNHHMAEILGSDYAASNVHVWNIPEEIPNVAPASGSHVLWASRIDDEKMPDLLLDITAAMPNLRFSVWGTPLLSGHLYMERIAASPNIEYRGGFTSFEDIDLSNIGCLLYTSRYDGKPNILVEAMARGLVCVASAVGGIPELLEGRGFLLAESATANDYAAAIRAALQGETSGALGSAARSFVEANHSKSVFSRQIEDILSTMGVP